MIKKLSLIAVISVAMTGCINVTPSGQEPVPAASASAPDLVTDRDALEFAWNTLNDEEKTAVCTLFNISPDQAFASFNEGADGAVSQFEFNSFFSQTC